MSIDNRLALIIADEQPRFEASVRAEMKRQGITVGILDKGKDGLYIVQNMRTRWEGWLACAVHRYNEASVYTRQRRRNERG